MLSTILGNYLTHLKCNNIQDRETDDAILLSKTEGLAAA